MKFFEELIKLNEAYTVYLVTAANAVHAIHMLVLALNLVM